YILRLLRRLQRLISCLRFLNKIHNFQNGMTVLPLRFRKGLCVRETSIDCSYQAVRYNGDGSIDRIDQALTYKGCWGGKEKRRDSRIKIVVGFGGRVCVCFRSGGFENFDRVWGIIFSRKKVLLCVLDYLVLVKGVL
ncbi:hypothetical protein ABKV19_026211, partial [Rosa sericea]